MATAFPEIISLNVGGEFHSTTLSTMLKEPKSVLGKIFSGKQRVVQDSKGRYFLDLDGQLFRYILDYLRHGKVVLPESNELQNRLKMESQSLGLYGLVDIIDKQEPSKGKAANYITVSYRGTFAFGRDGLADVKFRKIARILVAGRVSSCRAVFGDQLNETRDPDRGEAERYSARFYLKHIYLEQAFDTLCQSGYRMISCCASGTNGFCSDSKANADEESKWQHYNEFIFCSSQ